MPLPTLAFLGVMAAIVTALTLAFVADRLLAPHVPGFLSTLVFPAAWVALEFVSSRLNPYGTWGALAYSQYGNLPLMQLVSVTGIWGIAFLVAWFAAVVNWAWDLQFEWGRIRRGVLLYAAVWGVVMLAGGARLAFSPESTTVRVAGISVPRGIITASVETDRIFAPDFSATEREQVREYFARLQDAFFERSLREAQAGAKIAVWPEDDLLVFKEDEDAFLERARGFAREHAIFLLMGMATIDTGEPLPVNDHAVLIDPTGQIAYSYTKTTAVPITDAHNISGQGTIPVADTPYGRVASPICFDLDFPQLIQQVGQSQADIMLVPSDDPWKPMTRLHQQMAEFRAVENGVVMFRLAHQGWASAVDPYGRPLAAMDDLAAQDNVIVAQAPVSAGVPTIYARIGDLFAWLCVAGLLICIGTVIYRRGRVR